MALVRTVFFKKGSLNLARLNEILNSDSLNVPEKTSLIKFELEQHSDSLWLT